MTLIVAVHGINNTYSAHEVMAAEWVPSLLGGVSNAGFGGRLSAEDITCAFYGDVFRRPGRYLGMEDVETLDSDEIEDPTEAELLTQWWAEAARSDSGVMPPDAHALGGFGVQAALLALANCKFLAEASERLLILWIKQVRAYFTQSDVRARIQDRFAAAVTTETRVVVAHSLGSVVAYEMLAAHPSWNVTTMVTLGSPLGIPNVVLDRLRPAPGRVGKTRQGRWPEGIRHWTNIADRRDFVALNKKLHSVFGPELADVEIDNGARIHNVSPYLTAPETGAVIARGCKLRTGW